MLRIHRKHRSSLCLSSIQQGIRHVFEQSIVPSRFAPRGCRVCLGHRAGANPRACGRGTRRRSGTRAHPGQHVDRQHRAVQPVRFPRHLADGRQAGGAGRVRLRAFERLLSRHVGVEHQLARGFRPLQPVEPRMGLLRRLQEQLPRQRGLELRRRPLLLLLPGPTHQPPASTTPTRSRATAPSRGSG